MTPDDEQRTARSGSHRTVIEVQRLRADRRIVGRPSDSDLRLMAVFRARADGDVLALAQALQDPEHADAAARSFRKRPEIVSELERETLVRGLRRLLRARDPHSRASAAGALGELKAGETRTELIEIAQDDEVDFVRSWAVFALGKLGGELSRSVLEAFLDDPSYKVRREAAVALGTQGDACSLTRLEETLRRERWFRRKPLRVAIRQLRRLT